MTRIKNITDTPPVLIFQYNITVVANLRLASHMRLFEGLFVAPDKSDKSKYGMLNLKEKAACQIISIFGTTYLRESFYSTLKFL